MQVEESPGSEREERRQRADTSRAGASGAIAGREAMNEIANPIVAALRRLLAHAANHSPYYRDQVWAARLRAGETIAFRDVAITAKRQVKAQPSAFYCQSVPASEGETFDKFTSGSTGEPTLVKKTRRHFEINRQENSRLQSSWGVEAQTGILTIDATLREHRATGPIKTGPNNWKIESANPRDWVEALRVTRASMVSAVTSEALSLLEIAPDLESLRILSTVGELIPDELRQAVARLPDCVHVDTYGCVEAGIIAATCRHCGFYHLADRHAVVEILDDGGAPSEAGSMGRVVVTPLFNLATPLLRYEIGDYAIAAPTPGCAAAKRGLSKIVGRERNLFRLPDGMRVNPSIPSRDLVALGLSKHKMLQTSLREIQFFYVPLDPAAGLDAGALQRLVDFYISPQVLATPVRVEAIPKSPSGKYLMHESLVA
jgi:phenylacetate-CoA ligase